MVRRYVSDVLLVVYAVALVVLLWWAATVTMDLLKPSGSVVYLVPPVVLLALSYGSSLAIAIRIWIHVRARRRAERAAQTEQADA